jgi:hypothetical protein
MSRFYASPSFGLDTSTADSSATEGSSGSHHDALTPTERMRIIRKRMRSGKHKYSAGKFDAGGNQESSFDGFVDATVSAFAQSLKMKEIFTFDNDQSGNSTTSGTSTGNDNDAIATANASNVATPPPAKRVAIEEVDGGRRLGELSPPPTPGRNHAAARSYHSSSDHPTSLPLGDRRRLEVADLVHSPSTLMSTLAPGSHKVPSSLLVDSYPHAHGSYMYRIRPNFASARLQDLINERAGKRAQDQEEVGSNAENPVLPSTAGSAHILELPFAPPLYYLQSRQIEHANVLRHQHQQEEEGSPKVAVDMAVAPLPSTMGCFERANAA